MSREVTTRKRAIALAVARALAEEREAIACLLEDRSIHLAPHNPAASQAIRTLAELVRDRGRYDKVTR